jgi:hypothetical protein
MARKRTAKHPEAEAAPTGGVLDGNGFVSITKTQAVRNVLTDELKKIDDIVEFAKSRHGLDVSKQQASIYKSKEKQKGLITSAKPGRLPKAAIEDYVAPPKVEAKGDDDLLDAMEAIKPLVASLGAEKVNRIVDPLG